MKADWQGLAFRVVAYKDTGTYVIGGTDDVQVRVARRPLKILQLLFCVHEFNSAEDVVGGLLSLKSVLVFLSHLVVQYSVPSPMPCPHLLPPTPLPVTQHADPPPRPLP